MKPETTQTDSGRTQSNYGEPKGREEINIIVSFSSYTPTPCKVPCGGGGFVTKSCQTLATPWATACQDPLSMGFSRQDYWNVLPFPSPRDLSDPGIEIETPVLQADPLLTDL